MIDVAVLRAMHAAGCTTEQIIAAVEAAQTVERERQAELARLEEEKRAHRRQVDRVRQRRHRAGLAVTDVTHGHDVSRVTTRDERDPLETKVSPTPPSKTQNPLPPSPPSGALPPPKAGRASRLPDDWQPSTEDIANATAIGLHRQLIDREAAKFRDYWLGKGGEKGRKCDWPATWRNWCRKVAEDLNLAPAKPPATSPSVEPATPATDEAGWRKRLTSFRVSGAWLPEWGAPPDEPGTLVPPHLLNEGPPPASRARAPAREAAE